MLLAVTPEQIELLFNAAQSPFISAEARDRLSVANPWTMKGQVAEVLQREVVRLNPLQARLWSKEAGSTLSLKAAAAKQGLSEMTAELQDEINRITPQTQDEKNRELVARLTADGANPFDKRQKYDEHGRLQPSAYSLTNAMQLEMANPQLAAKLKAQANPEAPHNYTDREAQILSRHGYSLPTNNN